MYIHISFLKTNYKYDILLCLYHKPFLRSIMLFYNQCKERPLTRFHTSSQQWGWGPGQGLPASKACIFSPCTNSTPCPKQEHTNTHTHHKFFFFNHQNVPTMTTTLASSAAFPSSRHLFISIAPGSSKEVCYVLMCHLHPQAIYIANSGDSLPFRIFFPGGLFKRVLPGLLLTPP